jgi:hypothetical protein
VKRTLAAVLLAVSLSGCINPVEVIRLYEDNKQLQNLRRQNENMRRNLNQCT